MRDFVVCRALATQLSHGLKKVIEQFIIIIIVYKYAKVTLKVKVTAKAGIRNSKEDELPLHVIETPQFEDTRGLKLSSKQVV